MTVGDSLHLTSSPQGRTRNGGFCVGSILLLLVGGCASPGPPRPPSLNLPRPVTGFTAERVGDIVHLHWTTSSRSTDDLLLSGRHHAGALRANICRAAQGSDSCIHLRSIPVSAGDAVTVDDVLPPALTTGTPQLLRYRLALRNAAGNAADSTPEAVTASGSAPAAVEGLRAESRADGVHLHWSAAAGAASLRLQRSSASDSASAVPKRQKSTDQTLSVPLDRGGTIDPSAALGTTYTYTVARAEMLRFGGLTIVLHGLPATITVDRHQDSFPPAIPTGLAALTIDDSGAATDGTQHTSAEVNLSWQANTEPDLEGYFVYRIDPESPAAVPRRLTPSPITALSFDDLSAAAGHPYRYSVSAVNTSGRESARSPDIPSR